MMPAVFSVAARSRLVAARRVNASPVRSAQARADTRDNDKADPISVHRRHGEAAFDTRDSAKPWAPILGMERFRRNLSQSGQLSRLSAEQTRGGSLRRAGLEIASPLLDHDS